MTPMRKMMNLAVAALFAASPLTASAQTLAGDGGPARSNAYSHAFGPGAGPGAPAPGQQVLHLPKGKSAIVELPTDARDVLVSNPAVADAVLRHPRRIYIVAVANGQTDAVFFDAAGRRILSLDIRIGIDAGGLNDAVARLVPGSRVRAEAMNESVVLAGEVPDAMAADQIVRLAQSYVVKPEQVVNMMTIAGKDQVMLKVRIVEVQRTVVKQLGFDLSALVGQVGDAQFLFNKSATFAVNGGLLGGLSGGYTSNTTQQPMLEIPCSDPDLSGCYKVIKGPQDASNWDTATARDTVGSDDINKANAQIQALERVGLVRTLAEPNLTALSGESAKFLAGGEYPIPVSQDDTGRISVEFKPFGVGLGFTPVVLSEGRISLKLATEVSELTSNGGFTLGQGTSGSLTIPALNVRRAETTVELPSGGSMMIAGLLQDTTRQTLDSLPGMMNLPVLGALFRSRDYQKGETELVIIITPYLVKATSGRMQTPADGLRIAHDMETTLLGKLNKTNGTRAAAVQGKAYQGPYGYVIE
jgi:pilus assembly protein CpaC